MFEGQWSAWLAIGLTALVTYSFRFGGLSLAAHLPKSGPLRRGLDALPGCILVSLVAPAILHSGPWGLAGALISAGLTLAFRNVFIAMAAGMAVVALSRYMGW